MNKTVTAIEAEARKLIPTARLELVDAILGSLDETDPEMDRLWSREAEDRLAAYRRGEMSAVSLSDIFAAYGRP
ncbi:MAG: addiction module protein [Magnetococcales bacterium]|nr:addiction module protein [Magnetococcales bacterium]